VISSVFLNMKIMQT